MKLINKGFFYLTVLLVILSCFTQETEARRRVLRGRRVVTRQQQRGLPMPAWVIIVIVALANLIIGGILYAVMHRVVLHKIDDQSASYTPVRIDERGLIRNRKTRLCD